MLSRVLSFLAVVGRELVGVAFREEGLSEAPGNVCIVLVRDGEDDDGDEDEDDESVGGLVPFSLVKSDPLGKITCVWKGLFNKVALSKQRGRIESEDGSSVWMFTS